MHLILPLLQTKKRPPFGECLHVLIIILLEPTVKTYTRIFTLVRGGE
jgi:hypothetical protein